MEEEIKQSDYIDARERFNVPQVNTEPKVDKLITDKVGFTVYINNPIVIKTIVGWKKESNKSDSDTTPDNFLDDPAKVEELKKALQ